MAKSARAAWKQRIRQTSAEDSRRYRSRYYPYAYLQEPSINILLIYTSSIEFLLDRIWLGSGSHSADT